MSLSEARKKIGKIEGLTTRLKPFEFFSTGFPSLDQSLGGGWIYGRLFELYSPEGMGKTTLALHAIASEQAKGNHCLFIDLERKLNMAYAERLGIKFTPDLWEYVKPETAEIAFSAADAFASSGSTRLIVLDSVASMVPKSVANREWDDKEQGELARSLSRNIPRLLPSLDNNNCAMIMVNQVREKIGQLYGDPTTTPGGRTLKHNGAIRLKLAKGDWVKNEDNQIIGVDARIIPQKTSAGAPFKESKLRLIYDQGFSRGYDLLQFKLSNGEVVKSGSWFLIGEDKYQGEESAIRALLKKEEKQ